ncbi:MAG: hypothetical protein IPK98_18455 [Chloracidobacterium sp.]|nr:hypothetical protein [Chloracidobacterium sp.]
MALTKQDINEVYSTVEIELVRALELLSYHYMRPDKKEKAQLMAKIEAEIRKKLAFIKMPRSGPDGSFFH